MIVVDNGKVAAQGTVYDIAGRLDLGIGIERPLLGAILPAGVAPPNAGGKVAVLGVEGARFVVSNNSRPLGAALRIRIDAYDIMLARNQPSDISANNIFPVVVSAIHAEHSSPYADVQLMLGRWKMVSRITRFSLGRLNLSSGDHIFALVKSV